MNAKGLSVLELCAGGGGAALGLEQAGFKPAALIDNDADACATLRKNRPYWNVIQADIERFDPSYWSGTDLLSAGLPCPPFSIAGKQLGKGDERNMFPAMLKIAQKVKPRAILVENVRGLLSDKFTNFRNELDIALDSMGFDVHWTGFNAIGFGVPQYRFRVFLVALRRGETKTLKWPTASNGCATVGQTIGDLMSAKGWLQAESWIKRANAPAPTIVGGSFKHGGPDLGPTRSRHQWAALGVDGMGLANEPPDARFVGMPRLTLRMVARLQTFPDDWEFAGTKTKAYRQVGNALPVGLSRGVSEAVRQCLE